MTVIMRPPPNSSLSRLGDGDGSVQVHADGAA